MKKILTVSLFAMMAVSAANAYIASTDYVTERTGTTTNLATEAKELTGAVNELKTKLDTVAGDSTTSVADQIAAAKSELTTEIGKVDDKADENAAAIAGLDGTYATDEALSDGLALKEDVANKKGATYTSGSATEYTSVLAAETIANKAVAASKAQLGALADLDTVSTEYIDDKNVTKAKLADDVQASLGKADAAVPLTTYNSYVQANDAAVATKANSADVYTKTAADAEFMNSAEVDAAIAGAVTGTNGALKDYVTTTVFNQSQTDQTNELKEYADDVAAAAKSGAESTAATALNAYKTANDAVVATKANSADVYTKTAADAEFMDSDEVDAAIAGAVTGTNGALKDYSTTAQMNTAITNANSAQTTAITNAYTAADAATLDAAKADATSKANAAQTAAVNAAKDAADATYQVKSSALSVGAAGGAWTDLTKATGYSTTGTHSLVLKNGTIQWEQVSY